MKNELKHIEEKILSVGDIELNATFPCVKIKNTDQPITKYQFKLLRIFLQYANKVLTYSLIKDLLYNEQFITDNTVRTLICEVRKKIKTSECEIISYPDIGYKLKLKEYAS